MGKITSKNLQHYDRKLLWIAAGIGFLGNLAANFIWWSANEETKFWVGSVSFVGFILLFWGLSRGYGKIY